MERFLSGQPATGQNQLHRPGPGNLTRQADMRALVGNDAPAHFLQPELGVLSSDADVGAQHVLKPAGDAVAVHGRDDRLVDVMQIAGLLHPQWVVSRPGRLGRNCAAQISAGAERALTSSGQDRDPHFRIIVEVLGRVAQQPQQFHRHGVHPLGTVERDHATLVGRVFFVDQGKIGHCLPFGSCRGQFT